jgi:23S rRNA (adenine2503-C2)-methyltransferase
MSLSTPPRNCGDHASTYHWDTIREFADPTERVKKLVFTQSDCVAESTLYGSRSYEEHTIVCCSTMSGCPIGCRFCGSGDFFIRKLSASEIVSQAQYILENCIDGIDPTCIQKLDIRVMSMGEPLLNTSLWQAFHYLHALYPHATLQISTSAPDIDWSWVLDMSVAIPSVALQFSVHESTNQARDALIPFKRKLSLEGIADIGIAWHRTTGRRPSFNYCAHGCNVDQADADRLTGLFPPAIWDATVSVICERNEFQRAHNQHQHILALDFSSKLASRGFKVRIENPPAVETIGGGCGQLWFVQEWMRAHPSLVRRSVGNSLPARHPSPSRSVQSAADLCV